MSVNRITTAGDNRTTTAGDNRIHTAPDITLVPTRLSLNHTKIRRGIRMNWCTSCGEKKLLDGGLGAFNRTGYCGSRCYDKYRRANIMRVLTSSGNMNATIFENFRPTPGDT